MPPRPWTDGGTCGPLYTRPQDILRNLFDFRHMNINNEMKKRLKNRCFFLLLNAVFFK